MVPIAKRLKAYQECGAIEQWVAPTRFLNEYCFHTKTGELGLLTKSVGVNYEARTPEMLADVSKRIKAALRSLSPEFSLYQYLEKRRIRSFPSEEHYGQERLDSAVKSRLDFLAQRNLFQVSLHWGLLYDVRSSLHRLNALSAFRPAVEAVRAVADRVTRDVGYLESKAQSFTAETRDVLGLTLLDKHEIFRFLRRLLNLDEELADSLPLVSDEGINYFVADRQLAGHEEQVVVSDDFDMRVLSLRSEPKQVGPNFFEELYALECNFILCTRYQKLPAQKAKEEVANAKQHYTGLAKWITSIPALLNILFKKGKTEESKADQGASDNEKELDALASALNAGDDLGDFNCTLVLYGTKQEVNRASAEAIRVFGRREASLFSETGDNAFNAFLGIIPGNRALSQIRSLWLTSSDYADLSLAYARSAGNVRNEFLGREYLFITENTDRTPNYFNLHYGDVVNTFMCGQTGAGKSVLSNLCLEHLLKYNTHLTIFDIGGSYRSLCRRYDGVYLHFNLDNPQFRMNPFRRIPNTPSHVRSHCALLRLLFRNNGYQPTLDDNRNIYDAVHDIYTRPEDQRRLGNLKLRPELRRALANWVGKGEDAWLFDNEDDTVSFAELQVIDFQGAEDEDFTTIMEPLLFYLFRRHAAFVQDPANLALLKILWADETWRFVTNETCRRKFVGGAKTYRKHNAGMGLVTQSPADLANVGLLEIVNEVCPTKLFLHNPGANAWEYQRIFDWNDAELELFRSLVPKRDVFAKRGNQPGEKLQIHLEPEALMRYGNSPFENLAKEKAIAAHGFEKGLTIAAAGSR